MKLDLHNERMLELCDYLVVHKKITKMKFYESIGYNFSNISSLMRGSSSFTMAHVAKAVQVYKLDANYFFKKSAPMFELKRDLTAKELLQEALRKL